MSEKQFVDGLRAFRPGDRRPDFVKTELLINLPELGKWLRSWKEQNPGKEELRIDVNESRTGSFYAELNTFEPKQGGQPARHEKPDGIPF